MRRTLPLLFTITLMLFACGRNLASRSDATPTLPPTEQPAASATVAAAPASPTLAPTLPLPTVTAPVPTVPVATLTAELSATVVAALPPTATAAPGETAPLFAGIDSVNVQPLSVPADSQPLWVVSSVGFPDPERNQRHFVAIYTRRENGWQELARHEIDNADAMLAESVTQVTISPDRVWLLAESGVGAHSGCLQVLSFDGNALKQEVAGCNSSPVAGEVRDLDGDGVGEVILNGSDNYVFCYACGERYYSYQVYRWDGTAMQRLDLASAQVGNAGEPLHDALALARVGLWKDAQQVISQTQDVGSEPLAKLYAATIDLHAQSFGEQVQNGPYPLLDQLFYGDYQQALAVLRAYPPDQLFAKPSPLIAGTTAEGWDGQLTYWITNTTTMLLDANIGDGVEQLPAQARSPDTLAAAHFMRGWALTLSDPPDPQAIAEIERAVQLKPDDTFYQSALAYLKK